LIYEALDLENLEAEECDTIVQKLTSSNICLKEEEDKLVWERNLVGGFYTTKVGYEAMFSSKHEQNSLWRWKKVWKIKAPLKCKLFLFSLMYLVITLTYLWSFVRH
jgi:hypothetical protein